MGKKNNRLIALVAISAAIAVGVALVVSASFSNPPTNSTTNGTAVTDDNVTIDEDVEPVVHENQTDDVQNDTETIDFASYTQKRTIGNVLDVGPISGMSAVFIHDNNDMISVRFTSKYSGNATTVVTYFQQEGDVKPKVEVGLQADDGNGKPSGSWINEDSYGILTINRDGFSATELQSPAALEKGKTYHLVAKIPASDSEVPLASAIPMVVYNTNEPYLPLNENKTDILWPDPSINTLHFNGQVWREENHWPLFAIKFGDGRSLGQPYSVAAPWIIHGARHVGQALVPSDTYLLEKFAFVVNSKGGSQDKLYYEIKNADNKILSEGVFAENGTLGKSKQWLEVSLSTPIILKEGQLYRIALFSPNTAEPNSYQVYGHEFSYDVELGYGGSIQMLAASYSSGRSWERWVDADSIFRLEVAEKPIIS
jgi:hypothetical protein